MSPWILLSPYLSFSGIPWFWASHLRRFMTGGLWLGKAMSKQVLEGFRQEKLQKTKQNKRPEDISVMLVDGWI